MKNKWPALVQFPLPWNIFYWYSLLCMWCVCVVYLSLVCFLFFLSILVTLCESICSYVFNYSLISKYGNTRKYCISHQTIFLTQNQKAFLLRQSRVCALKTCYSLLQDTTYYLLPTPSPQKMYQKKKRNVQKRNLRRLPQIYF